MFVLTCFTSGFKSVFLDFVSAVGREEDCFSLSETFLVTFLVTFDPGSSGTTGFECSVSVVEGCEESSRCARDTEADERFSSSDEISD